MKRRLFGKGEILLISVVIAAALVLWGVRALLSRGSGEYVVVTVSGVEYARLPLGDDAELLIQGEGGENLLVISGGHAEITRADCSNQVCVDTGSISEPGELIVCLPHKVVVTIEGE